MGIDDKRYAHVIAAARAKTPRGEVDPESPPKGTWSRDDGVEQEVGASTRQIFGALGVAILVLCSLALVVLVVWAGGGDVMRSLGLWPAPAGASASLGSGAAAVLLGLGAFAFAVALAWYAAVLVCGSVRVRLARGVVTVSMGAGPFQWKRTMDAGDATCVSESIDIWRTKHGPAAMRVIVIERASGPGLRFGSNLNAERSWWVRGMTGRMLGVPVEVIPVDEVSRATGP